MKITMVATATANAPTATTTTTTTPIRRSNSNVSIRSVAESCSTAGSSDVGGDGRSGSRGGSCGGGGGSAADSDSDDGGSAADKTRTRKRKRKRTRPTAAATVPASTSAAQTTNTTTTKVMNLNFVVVRVGFLVVAGLLSSLQYKNAFYLLDVDDYHHEYDDVHHHHHRHHRHEDTNDRGRHFLPRGRRIDSNDAAATTTATTTTTTAKTAPIFYNVFVRNGDELGLVQDEIVDDQLRHIDPTIHGPVYYTSLGPVPISITLPTTAAAAAAAADGTVNISRIQHLEVGDETATLHSLWSYCKGHPTERVVYLHSKGSFHPTTQNYDLRRLVTTAALSEECSQATARRQDDEDEELGGRCDVCSARFSPLPHAHTSGNMWMARCDYVSKLLDPRQTFRQAMDDAYPVADPALRHLRPVFDRLGVRNGHKLHCHGLGRYAAEHWIHSHPSVRPCDVYKNHEFVWGYKGIPPSPSSSISSISSSSSLVETTDSSTSFVMDGNDDRSNSSSSSNSSSNGSTNKDYYDYGFEVASAPRFQSIGMYDLDFMLKTTCKQTLDQFWQTYGQNLLNEYRVLYGTGTGGDGDELPSGEQNRTDELLLPTTWWGWNITEFRERLLNGTFVTKRNIDRINNDTLIHNSNNNDNNATAMS